MGQKAKGSTNLKPALVSNILLGHIGRVKLYQDEISVFNLFQRQRTEHGTHYHDAYKTYIIYDSVGTQYPMSESFASFLFQGSSLMTTLFESWTQCQGNWKTSSIYLQIVRRDTTVRKGVRRWMIWKEVVERFGEEGATALIEYKKNDEELAKKEIRPHPSAPNVKELSS